MLGLESYKIILNAHYKIYQKQSWKTTHRVYKKCLHFNREWKSLALTEKQADIVKYIEECNIVLKSQSF